MSLVDFLDNHILPSKFIELSLKHKLEDVCDTW